MLGYINALSGVLGAKFPSFAIKANYVNIPNLPGRRMQLNTGVSLPTRYDL